jgi:hypothetical protein
MVKVAQLPNLVPKKITILKSVMCVCEREREREREREWMNECMWENEWMNVYSYF